MPRRSLVGGFGLAIAMALWVGGAGGSPHPQHLYLQSGPAVVAVDTANPKRVTPIAQPFYQAYGLSVGDGYVFWLGQRSVANPAGALWRARENGGDARPIIRNLDVGGSHSGSGGSTAVVGHSVYWVDVGGLSSATVDGTRVHHLAIPMSFPVDNIATDGHNLFFTACHDHAIGRVATDGSGLNRKFISLGRSDCPQGLAIGGGVVYWTALGDGTDPGFIDRAKLDGTHANNTWRRIDGPPGPLGLAADRRFVYWTHWTSPENGKGYVGRVNANGTNLEQVIVRARRPDSMALSP